MSTFQQSQNFTQGFSGFQQGGSSSSFAFGKSAQGGVPDIPEPIFSSGTQGQASSQAAAVPDIPEPIFSTGPQGGASAAGASAAFSHGASASFGAGGPPNVPDIPEPKSCPPVLALKPCS